MTYGIVKALHIISIVAWMAGILYLPRCSSTIRNWPEGSEARLDLRGDGAAAAEGDHAAGDAGELGLRLWLATLWGLLDARLAACEARARRRVAGVHGFLASEARRLAQGEKATADAFYRIINEVPTLISDPGGVPRGAEAVFEAASGGMTVEVDRTRCGQLALRRLGGARDLAAAVSKNETFSLCIAGKTAM